MLFFLLLLGSQTLLKVLHYCPISPCFQHIAPFHASLHDNLEPAALPGSLARQPCTAALPGSPARQACPAPLQKYYKF
jgi:hypothetical protein